MVRSLKPSSLAGLARAVPASSRTRAANRDLRRIVMEGRVIAVACRSSALLHRNMEDAGAIIIRRAAGGIRSFLIEAARLDLCRQRQLCRSAPSRFGLEKRKEPLPHSPPPDVIDHSHPLNLRHLWRSEDESAGAARNPIEHRQCVHCLAV